MKALYLRPLYDDKHGLLALSPGGGSVPRMYWRGDRWTDEHSVRDSTGALVLRTADGTMDPLGMARARHVLAAMEGDGALFGDTWYPGDGRVLDVSDPDAMAEALEGLGIVEVIRG